MTDSPVLPTCSASPNRDAHHRRHWLILEGLGLFDGGPLAISASEGWDMHALQCHGLVRIEASRGGISRVRLTELGRSMLDAREAEHEREAGPADSKAQQP